MSRLAANVYVDGVLHAAGSVPPAVTAERITNPKAWEADEADATPVAEVTDDDAPDEADATPVAEVTDDDAPDEADATPVAEVKPRGRSRR